MAPADSGRPQKSVDFSDLKFRLTDLADRIAELKSGLDIDQLKVEKTSLEKQVMEDSLWNDPERAKDLQLRLKRVTKTIEEFAYLEKDMEDLGTLLEMSIEFDESGEITSLINGCEKLHLRVLELETRTLLNGPYDECDAVCEIHSGAGGTDAQDWAEMLLRMYERFCEKNGFDFELDDFTEGQQAGLLSATFIVKGEHAFGYLKGEAGVHRLVRISPFDSNHRRHTSFAGVTVIPMIEPDKSKLEIAEDEIKIDTFRSSGAGGQHVNKTDSAVRITHLPTNIVVVCQNQRSQFQNKERAMQILLSKLANLAREEHAEKLNQLSGPQTEMAWGNQIRSYVLAPYQQVKDLRTGYETGNVQAVLDGEIKPFLLNYLHKSRMTPAS